MFANTSDWRFDRPGHNYYVQFIDKVMRGDLDEEFTTPISDRSNSSPTSGGRKTVQKLNGSLPVPMCKYWGEADGDGWRTTSGPRSSNFRTRKKDELRRELASVQQLVPSRWVKRMILMVSVQNLAEALEAVEGRSGYSRRQESPGGARGVGPSQGRQGDPRCRAR